MKRIFFVLIAGIVMMSCNEADQTSEDNSNSAPTTNATVSANTSTAANTPGVQTPAVDTSQLTTIEWLDGTTRNMGTMKSGDKLNVVFRFKNTGTKPLIIKAVTPRCGCTASDRPTKPFAPGEIGEIKAGFDSNGQGTGSKSKSVDVVANTSPEMTSLIFNVDVKEKPKS